MFVMLFQILPGLPSLPVFYYQSKKVVYCKRTNSFHYACLDMLCIKTSSYFVS